MGVGTIILCPLRHLRKLYDTKSSNDTKLYYFYY